MILRLLVVLFVLSTLSWATARADAGSGQSLKEDIGHMHHELHDVQAAFKKSEAQAQKELNELTIQDDVKMEDINRKIDELMEAKTQILRLRYAHLVEMRAALSEEQRVGYDKAVLKRSAIE